MPRAAHLPLLLLLCALLWALRLLGAAGGGAADEELHSPTAAWLLSARPDPRLLAALQYTPFCGGCSAETLLFAPLAGLFGPRLWLWKLIPLGVQLALVGLLHSLLRRERGEQAAVVGALALIAAPSWYAAQSLVAFGAHTELGALVLLLLWASPRLGELGFGLCAGLMLCFDYAAAAALVLLWPARLGLSGRAQLRALAGLGLGLLPWLLTRLLRAESLWPSIYGGAPSSPWRRLDELLGPTQWASTWYPLYSAGRAGAGLLATLAAALTVLLAGLRGLRRGERAPSLAAGLCLSFALAFVFLAPQRGPLDEGPLTANSLRYLAPLPPLVALCLGLALPRRLGPGGLLLALALIGPGLAARMAELQPERWSTRPLRQHALDINSVLDRIPPRQPLPAAWPEEGEPAALLAAQLELLPAPRPGRHPRELELRALGLQMLGPAFTRSPGARAGRQLLPLLLAQPSGDQALLLDGLALHLQRYGGYASPDPHPLPPMAALLDMMEGAQGQALALSLLRHEGAGPALARQLAEGWAAGGPEAWERARLRAAGLATPEHLLGEAPAEALALALRPLGQGLGAEARGDWLEGVGEALADRHLHDPALLERIAGQLDALDADALRRGAARSSAGWR